MICTIVLACVSINIHLKHCWKPSGCAGYRWIGRSPPRPHSWCQHGLVFPWHMQKVAWGGCLKNGTLCTLPSFEKGKSSSCHLRGNLAGQQSLCDCVPIREGAGAFPLSSKISASPLPLPHPGGLHHPLLSYLTSQVLGSAAGSGPPPRLLCTW